MEMLRIENLSFYYDVGTPIFTDLDLTFDTRTTAIIGQNGAGKSTLVKIIKRLLTQQAGNIYLEGEMMDDWSAAQVAKEIGMVFQNPDDQIFKSKVLDEVMFGPLQVGMTESESLKIAQAALKEVGLLDKQDANPYDLSLSDRKMIAIASIVAMDTKIIIFDEPTIAQDAHGKKIIQGIIERLQAEGKLVITIIHDMDFVAAHFERTVILAHGDVLFDGPTKEAFGAFGALTEAKLDIPHIAELGFAVGLQEVVLSVDELLAKYQVQK